MSLGSNPPARQQNIASLSMNIAQPTFDEWASRDNVDLFAESSDLLLRVIFTTCFGRDFAEAHFGELSAIMRGLQQGLTSPWSRLLPLWATPAGRGILRARSSLQDLLTAEVQDRLNDLDNCRESEDYLSFMLVSNGDKGSVGTDSELTAHFVSCSVSASSLREDIDKRSNMTSRPRTSSPHMPIWQAYSAGLSCTFSKIQTSCPLSRPRSLKIRALMMALTRSRPCH